MSTCCLAALCDLYRAKADLAIPVHLNAVKKNEGSNKTVVLALNLQSFETFNLFLMNMLLFLINLALFNFVFHFLAVCACTEKEDSWLLWKSIIFLSNSFFFSACLWQILRFFCVSEEIIDSCSLWKVFENVYGYLWLL